MDDDSKLHALPGVWDLYYHAPEEKKWDLDSYQVMQKNMASVEDAYFVASRMHEAMLKKCMFFVMRAGITPMWEDARNRSGGCFSFKVTFRHAEQIWRHLLFALCGETLFLDHRHCALVNGITISPKKFFCIIKVWLADCSLQDPALMIPIANLNLAGCLFRNHAPEF